MQAISDSDSAATIAPLLLRAAYTRALMTTRSFTHKHVMPHVSALPGIVFGVVTVLPWRGGHDQTQEHGSRYAHLRCSESPIGLGAGASCTLRWQRIEAR